MPDDIDIIHQNTENSEQRIKQAVNNSQAGDALLNSSSIAQPVRAPRWALTAALVQQMIAHARTCYPREACGLLAGNQMSVLRLYPTRNVASGDQWFQVDPEEQRRVFADIVRNGWYLLAIYHSHPHRHATPSRNDVRLAAYPGVLSLIISLADWEHPEIRGYWIGKGQAVEALLNQTVPGAEGTCP